MPPMIRNGCTNGTRNHDFILQIPLIQNHRNETAKRENLHWTPPTNIQQKSFQNMKCVTEKSKSNDSIKKDTKTRFQKHFLDPKYVLQKLQASYNKQYCSGHPKPVMGPIETLNPIIIFKKKKESNQIHSNCKFN